jgi:hypothetical protein
MVPLRRRRLVYAAFLANSHLSHRGSRQHNPSKPKRMLSQSPVEKSVRENRITKLPIPIITQFGVINYNSWLFPFKLTLMEKISYEVGY